MRPTADSLETARNALAAPDARREPAWRTVGAGALAAIGALCLLGLVVTQGPGRSEAPAGATGVRAQLTP